MKKWLSTTLKHTDLGLLLIRICVGLFFALHGYGKLGSPDGLIDLVGGKLAFPMPTFFAWAAILSEFIGGLCLALGLLTRVWLVPMAVTMGVAAFWLHGDDVFGDGESALIYLLVFVGLFFTGPGAYSVDRKLFG